MVVTKAGTSAAAAAVIALAAQTVMVALAVVLAPAKRGRPLVCAEPPPRVRTVLRCGGVGRAGVTVGALSRHQVAAVVGRLVSVLVVENLPSGLLEGAARFLPSQAVHGRSQCYRWQRSDAGEAAAFSGTPWSSGCSLG